MDIDNVIKQLEDEIAYFNNISFPIIANKFQRDLNAIKYLIEKKDKS